MSHAPRVSVLLPVFNARPFLDECLRSLTQQTHDDFEVVAVDDGSTDGSREILESWSELDARIRVLRRPHLGHLAALNAGLETCGGELIARMDADDVSHRDRLRLQVAAFDAQPALSVVSCKVKHFPEAEVAEGFRAYEEWLNGLLSHELIMRDRFIESPIPHPTAMVRSTTFREAGGYHDHGWPEDYDLWLRLAHAGKQFRKVPQTLYYWRQHNARLTRTDSRYAVEKFLACKARYLLAGPLQGVGGVLVWGAGQTGRRLSKHLIRRGAPVDAFIDIDPEKIGRTLRGRPIVGVESLGDLFSSPQRNVLLVAVSSRGARQLIREKLDQAGLRETSDYWLAA